MRDVSANDLLIRMASQEGVASIDLAIGFRVFGRNANMLNPFPRQ
jgi:hypothetical protein